MSVTCVVWCESYRIRETKHRRKYVRPTLARATQPTGRASVDMLSALLSATASHVFIATFCCCPEMKEIEQTFQVALTIDCCNDDYVTAFHLAACLTRTCSYALLMLTMRLIECTSLSDYHKSNSKYLKTEFKFKFINQSCFIGSILSALFVLISALL